MQVHDAAVDVVDVELLEDDADVGELLDELSVELVVELVVEL